MIFRGESVFREERVPFVERGFCAERVSFPTYISTSVLSENFFSIRDSCSDEIRGAPRCLAYALTRLCASEEFFFIYDHHTSNDRRSIDVELHIYFADSSTTHLFRRFSTGASNIWWRTSISQIRMKSYMISNSFSEAYNISTKTS